jgi:hypothetical protein
MQYRQGEVTRFMAIEEICMNVGFKKLAPLEDAKKIVKSSIKKQKFDYEFLIRKLLTK